METVFVVVVTAFVIYGIYHVWYVPRETSKKVDGSRSVDSVKRAKK